MSLVHHPRPAFTLDAARALLQAEFGLAGELTPLDSERDQNFRVASGQSVFTLKIVNAAEPASAMALQTALLDHVAAVDASLPLPRVVRLGDGRSVGEVEGPTGERHAIRLVTYLPGVPLAQVERSVVALHGLGAALGRLDRALMSFGHPGAFRDFDWHIHAVPRSRARLEAVRDPGHRALVSRLLDGFDARIVPAFPHLRHQVIHNDANDWNVLLAPGTDQVTGLIDVGDAVFAPLAAEPAVACAYAMLGDAEPLEAAAAVVAAFHAEMPLTEAELEALFDLIAGRLCISVTMSALRQATTTDPYHFVSEAPAWHLLHWLDATDRGAFATSLKRACAQGRHETPPRDAAALLEARRRHLGKNLSLSYRTPLHIVRGDDVWLIDALGRRYLDCYNNVAHVGHCHPAVVAALAQQAARLNTNTRYLHENVVRYAERLAATLPPGLDCLYFCNSGSEANDLALRIARTATRRQGIAVLDWAYHGHTQALIEISPYKYKRSGGAGRPAFVCELPLPDSYRAPEDWPTLELGGRFAAQARRDLAAAARDGWAPAAFIAETIPSVGGQVFLPPDYLREIYAAIRAAGGLCIADEVQVGVGRVGTSMWAFTEHEVVPDIVTIGKPVGAGHPLAVVATTQALASAFANGMEYFNTFGGNPVSAAVGLAVLDVLRDQRLLENAVTQGDYIRHGLRGLADRHQAIGDVRGRGLFLGLEFVTDRRTKTPDGAAAVAVVNRAVELGVLMGTDGPHDNVVKLRPPMTFTRAHADLLLGVMARALDEVCGAGAAPP
ncbi:MAG: aminotransferase class III-fold pyridoxal phosphate-dependent enzyme [Acidobacteriota bacterium]